MGVRHHMKIKLLYMDVCVFKAKTELTQGLKLLDCHNGNIVHHPESKCTYARYTFSFQNDSTELFYST